MTSIIQSKDMVVSTVSKSGYTVGANGYVEITIDVTKSGYKPIGVVGIDKWGGGSVSIVISTYYINGNNFKAYLRNVGNTSADANLTVHILYQKA